MYVVIITKERFVDNPYWTPNNSKIEPARLEEQYIEVRYANSEETLTSIVKDLYKQKCVKVEYYNAYEVFPKLVTTVSLEIQ
jgi:hypothetical protein